MKKLVSVAICPPLDIIEQVRTIKKLLATEIRWYNSKNAEAHITFNNLMVGEEELSILENYLNNFCKTTTPLRLSFNGFDSFTNGAIFLSPDETSRLTLVNTMKIFHKGMPFAAEHKSIEPHITIGRKLSSKQLAIAKDMLTRQNININFLCERITIREFDEQAKQYKIYKHFLFTDKKLFPD